MLKASTLLEATELIRSKIHCYIATVQSLIEKRTVEYFYLLMVGRQVVFPARVAQGGGLVGWLVDGREAESARVSHFESTRLID